MDMYSALNLLQKHIITKQLNKLISEGLSKNGKPPARLLIASGDPSSNRAMTSISKKTKSEF